MIPFVLDQAECDAFGHKVYRFDQAVDLKPSYDKLVYLDKLVQPLILIKPGRVYVKACAVCNAEGIGEEGILRCSCHYIHPGWMLR